MWRKVYKDFEGCKKTSTVWLWKQLVHGDAMLKSGVKDNYTTPAKTITVDDC